MVSSYYHPDLSGIDPACKVDNDTYTIFTQDQLIRFDGPVYLDSIVVTKMGTMNAILVKQDDWHVPNSYIDYTVMARIKTDDPSFDKTLVDGITIGTSNTFAGEESFVVNISYQKLYPVIDKIANYDNATVNLTPDLIVNMLRRLSDVELAANNVANVNAVATTDAPVLLELDRDKRNPKNVVIDRNIIVNTYNGLNYINPVNGSFFKDSVVLSIPSPSGSGSPQILVENTDYFIFGCDMPKTGMTINKSGVYNFILVLKPYAGPVNLTYHAFGGSVTQYDVASVYKQLQNVISYLSESHFLTDTNLSNTDAFSSVVSRITNLESRMRSLITTGNPNYGDSTGGTFVTKKLQANDTNLHWWSIAHLYKVTGSSEIVISDRMHFRFQMQQGGLSADVFVNVDLNTEEVFTIDTVSVNQKLGYKPFGNYGTAPVAMPQFRVIYNTDAGNTSGVVLQMGLALSNLIETVGIVDLSDVESCWILDPASPTTVTPIDDVITLPNGMAVWSKANGTSKSVVHMMPNKTGYLAWGGAMALVQGPNTISNLLGTSFNIQDIHVVRLEFTDTADNSIIIPRDVPMSLAPNTLGMCGITEIDGNKIIISITTAGDLCVLKLTPTSTMTLLLRHVIVKV